MPKNRVVLRGPCDACGDGGFMLRVARRWRFLCHECEAELVDGTIPKLWEPDGKTPRAKPVRKTLGFCSRGEGGDPSPWQENAVRELEGG
jgi:hypothetical protein